MTTKKNANAHKLFSTNFKTHLCNEMFLNKPNIHTESHRASSARFQIFLKLGLILKFFNQKLDELLVVKRLH